MISKNWRGEGAQGEKLQSIFIVNPALDELDEGEGLVNDMFSTHPPIESRIGILLNMAHLDEKTLEENLKDFKRISPVASPEVSVEDESLPKKWFVFLDQKWAGPFLPEELKNLPGMTPEQWVRPDGATAVRHAYEEEPLMSLFGAQKTDAAQLTCPHCKTPIGEISYEGAPAYKCSYCEGIFVEYDKITRILIRSDMEFSQETVRLAETIMESKKNMTQGLTKVALSNPWVLDCPKCGTGGKMRRQFFVYSYPVEIDRCVSCGGVWFDKQELEVLQYIYEHKEKFFDGNDF